MRRLLLFIFCLFTLSGFVHAQRMSDEQVVEYVKNAQAAGKSQKQMTTELLRRGVTQEQVLRIKSRYEATNSTAEGTGNKPNQMRKHAVALDSLMKLQSWKTRRLSLMKSRIAKLIWKCLPGRFSVTIYSEIPI